MAGSASVSVSGNPNIDMVMSGLKWNTTSLSFGFPTTRSTWSAYDSGSEPYTDFGELPAAEQQAVRDVLASWSAVCNLNFTEVREPGTIADLRFAMTSQSDTAHAYFPSNSAIGGDTWFGPNFVGTDWTPGNYEYHTVVHEIGHALGLKHPHEAADEPTGGGVADLGIDTVEFSVMSYRSFTGDSVEAGAGYQIEAGSYPQAPMVNDIAAVQYLYGANYATNASNTVYTFSPDTAKIFQAVWDGGGTDTYDLSAYTTNLSVSLVPGAWSTFSSSQLAVLSQSDGSELARGNVANAYLYNNDPRSLIENATGGSGNDAITGNDVANTLIGGQGSDTVYGGIGADALYGNQDSDLLYGNRGDDSVFGGQGGDVIFGGNGNDALYGNLADDLIYAGEGTDLIFGGQGADTIYGEAGNDTLIGNLGDDLMFGGTGADRFVIVGNDVIGDFNAADGDRIQLAAGVTYAVAAGTGGAVVTFSNGNTVTLSGVDAGQVSSSWFAV